MAEALRDQVDALTGFSTTEDLALKDWFEAGIKEVINYMPPKLLKLCAAMQTFTSVAAGSEAETLNTGKILSVLSSNTRCREIASDLKGRASDSDDILYATSTDPVFYVEANLINALPSGLSCKYEEVQYPTVTVASDTAIAVFPDEAEYLVVLYAAIKALQVLMNDTVTNTAIDTTAIALVNDAIDQAATAAGKFLTDASDSVFGDEATFLTADSQLTRVKAALDDAEDVINANEPSATTDAYGAQSNEDIELVTSALNIAQTEIRRAQAHLAEWVAIGDMRAKEANLALAEASGYVQEITTRMARDRQKYDWYASQQAKLQSDYDRGLMALSGRQFAPPRAGGQYERPRVGA